jgi:glycosyltransferase involved in cell wall biosynthesis
VNDGRLSVALDATPLISGRTGVARYVTELAAALERQGVDVRRFAVGRASVQPPPGLRRIRVPLRFVERWWQIAPTPRVERLVDGADVVHATSLTVPPSRRPLVVTVHDLAAVEHPHLHPPRQVHQLRGLLAALDRADAILAVSQTTADALMARGVDTAKIFVTLNGATPFREAESTPSVDTTGLPEPGSYLLAVGETSARKGYPTLLRALAQLGGVAPRLVVVGPAGGDEARIRDLIAELDLRHCVVRFGAVNDEELAHLYRGALALCFTSIAEGFGLPVLEAFATGVPVIAAEIPAVREVAGDAAFFVPPNDEDRLAEALRAVSSDSGLRARLAAAGLERAAAFSWDDTAERTLAAYQTALAVARS